MKDIMNEKLLENEQKEMELHEDHLVNISLSPPHHKTSPKNADTESSEPGDGESGGFSQVSGYKNP
jgi:hypothetical protein